MQVCLYSRRTAYAYKIRESKLDTTFVNEKQVQRHLSQIYTDPAVVRWLSGASDLGNDLVTTARRRFFERYSEAVYAFVRQLLRDPGATEEVVQQFAVRVLDRSFRGYSPEKGRFRDYLKMTLRNMVTDYWRGVQRSRRFGGESIDVAAVEIPEPAELDGVLSAEEGELESLLERTFARLSDVRQSARPTYYEVLSHVAKYPDQSSDEAAAALTLELSLPKPINAAALRQTLRRAREKFKELFLEELGVPASPNREELIQERLSAMQVSRFFNAV